MKTYDIVIVGSGIAGLSVAIKASKFARIALITKSKLEDSNTNLAQGGLAATIGKDDDVKLHYFDTLRAGDGLCNKEAVKILVNNAPNEIKWLMNQKVKFDKKNNMLALSKEAVHSRPRIVHNKDATGKEIVQTLIKNVKKINNIDIFENYFLIHLITLENKCLGLVTLDKKNDTIKTFYSKYTVLATGGCGQVFRHTANSEIANGDGVAIAYRAKAKIQDMEFYQFHPTALFKSNPTFLLSETLRGEGGLLKNKFGKTYMEKYHREGQLAPRDVVSKFSIIEMQKTKSNCVYLDISYKDPNYIKKRFPNIFKTCLQYGIDISEKPIPVIPTAHYMIGGIRTDLEGKTSIKNLYAIGEVSCNGVHGADRLASNSLIDALVFGTMAVKSIKTLIKQEKICVKKQEYYYLINKKRIKNILFLKNKVREIMWSKAGIIRRIKSLGTALKQLNKIEKISSKIIGNGINTDILELRNLITVAKLIVIFALKRKESRGTHFLQEFPTRNNKKWVKHLFI